MLAALPNRERRVLTMRFYGSIAQPEIADQLGCSQMRVSRIPAKTLRDRALPD
nr:sigma factor-like helix-turn-helix DNA-binding protein [Nocardia miyunensis]